MCGHRFARPLWRKIRHDERSAPDLAPGQPAETRGTQRSTRFSLTAVLRLLQRLPGTQANWRSYRCRGGPRIISFIEDPLVVGVPQWARNPAVEGVPEEGASGGT